MFACEKAGRGPPNLPVTLTSCISATGARGGTGLPAHYCVSEGRRGMTPWLSCTGGPGHGNIRLACSTASSETQHICQSKPPLDQAFTQQNRQRLKEEELALPRHIYCPKGLGKHDFGIASDQELRKRNTPSTVNSPAKSNSRSQQKNMIKHKSNLFSANHVPLNPN